MSGLGGSLAFGLGGGSGGGGGGTGPTRGSFWGPHMPEAPALPTFFAGHFPQEFSTAVGSTPPTVGAFILESGATMEIRWSTGIGPSLTDRERRSSLQDDPVLTFTGAALFARDKVLLSRSMLVQFAALGETFSLGLPWEGLAVDDEANGKTIYVPSTTNVDWVAIGVRVLVSHPENGELESFITAFDGVSITLNDTVGDVGDLGADIMPVIQVFLDPQQPMDRYTGEDDVERWQIKAVAAVPGIVRAATFAQLALSSVGGSGVMDGVTLVAPTIGSAGNALAIQFIADVTHFAEVVGSTLEYHFIPGVTTVAEMMGKIERTDFVAVLGDRPGDVLTIDDVFGPTNLSGGADQLPVDMGQGVTLATFRGMNIWDRPINAANTAQDSIQTRAPIVEVGSGRFTASSGPVAAWGRQLSIRAEIFEQWQWLKKFMWTVRGAWKKFWVPTWRRDLLWMQTLSGSIKIASGAAYGDFFKWYPSLRNCIQIMQDTSFTYARISAAVDNGDGTITLSIVDELDAPITLSGVEVDRISWLEQTRFSSDVQTPKFEGSKVELNATGRVVQQ